MNGTNLGVSGFHVHPERMYNSGIKYFLMCQALVVTMSRVGAGGLLELHIQGRGGCDEVPSGGRGGQCSKEGTQDNEIKRGAG